MVGANHISPRGKLRIKAFEALRLKPYKPTPNDVPTIGWGHTGKDVIMSMAPITVQRADELFNVDCAACEWTALHLKNPLTQNQMDALGSLIFNVGSVGFLGSRLRLYLDARNFTNAKVEWLNWDHQGKVELEGLKKRREEEWELFMSPTA